MNLDKIKREVYNELNIYHCFIFKSVRNQVENFNGKIIKCYPSVFIIETSDKVIKAFSYSDYIIGNIKIIS